ncbi:MAG: sterol desaturase family protein [Rhizobacter sp.]
MALFGLEHSRFAYRADFVLHGAAVASLAGVLLLAGPVDRWLALVSLVFAGLVGWTALEYALHRFVLHGVRPFSSWHAQHHQRPAALIYAPTVMIALLFVVGVFLPALALFDAWIACALTLGLLSGYLAYAVTHHATHHWRADGAWLKRRKRWHALHHHHTEQPACYGVTTAVWDHAFGSTGQRRHTDGGSGGDWKRA